MVIDRVLRRKVHIFIPIRQKEHIETIFSVLKTSVIPSIPNNGFMNQFRPWNGVVGSDLIIRHLAMYRRFSKHYSLWN